MDSLSATWLMTQIVRQLHSCASIWINAMVMELVNGTASANVMMATKLLIALRRWSYLITTIVSSSTLMALNGSISSTRAAFKPMSSLNYRLLLSMSWISTSPRDFTVSPLNSTMMLRLSNSLWSSSPLSLSQALADLQPLWELMLLNTMETCSTSLSYKLLS